jgi:hypothetical protein
MVSVAASVMVAILATVIISTVTTSAVSVTTAFMVTVSVATAVMVAVPRAVVIVVTAIPGGRGRGSRRGRGTGVALKLEAEISGAIWVVGAGERAVLGASRVGLRGGGARVVGRRREDGVDDGEERAHEVVG